MSQNTKLSLVRFPTFLRPKWRLKSFCENWLICEHKSSSPEIRDAVQDNDDLIICIFLGEDIGHNEGGMAETYISKQNATLWSILMSENAENLFHCNV